MDAASGYPSSFSVPVAARGRCVALRSERWIWRAGVGLVLGAGVVTIALASGGATPLKPGIRNVVVVAAVDDPAQQEGRPEYSADAKLTPGLCYVYQTEPRYVGPCPTLEELHAYLANGQAEGFRYLLKAAHRRTVQDALVAIERAYVELAKRRQAEIDLAKAQLRGTEDEHTIERQTAAGMLRLREITERRNRSQTADELWVSQSGAKVETHYRIDFQRFATLKKVQEELLRHERLCREVAALETEKVLREHGLAALDEAQVAAVAAAFAEGR